MRQRCLSQTLLFAFHHYCGARIAEQLARIHLDKKSGATLAVTSLHSGSEVLLHAIPEKAEVIVNYRSQSPQVMKQMEREVHRVVEEESEGYGISFDTKIFCNAPCGTQDIERPIIKELADVITDLGGKVRFAEGGCTNANSAIASGISSVAIGSSNRDFLEHTPDEYMEISDAHKCIQSVYLLLLRIDGKE